MIRPADANEVAEAWTRRRSTASTSPVALVLIRQALPTLDRDEVRAAPRACAKGGYVLADPPDGKPEVILIAHRQRGRALRRRLRGAEGRGHRGPRRQHAVLGAVRAAGRRPTATRSCRPRSRARVSVEQASTLGWDRWVGPEGATVGMHTFGSSAPLKDVMNEFGFTPDKVAEAARGAIERAARIETSN